jgi:signal transduction histidine kinase
LLVDLSNLGPERGLVVGGSSDLASADRPIFQIRRAADDKAAEGVYLDPVRTGPSRLRGARLNPLRIDWFVAAVLTLGLELEVWLGTAASGERLATATLGAVVTAAVAVRRLYPATVGLTAGFVAALLAGVWGPPSLVSWGIAWLCCMYAFAVWATTRRFAFGAPAITLAGIASGFGAVPLGSALQFSVIALVAMVVARRVVGDRERRAQLAERERDLAAREAVVEERARIARELHDAIAHNVSMMVVQAGAERRVLDATSASTKEVLGTIERIGRGALTEMRRLVGMLRSDARDPLAPQPGLADLPTLIGQVREAGLPVDLQIDGQRRELPVGIELSAYRIVQEALTNALKHAGESHASVRVHYGADSLELEIVDDGAGAQAPVASGGHGLVGMRERVALYGGRLDAGRRPSGGFAVRVLLPIQ